MFDRPIIALKDEEEMEAALHKDDANKKDGKTIIEGEVVDSSARSKTANAKKGSAGSRKKRRKK